MSQPAYNTPNENFTKAPFTSKVPISERAPQVVNSEDSEEDASSTVATPEGYDSVEDFLKEAREEFQLDLDADKENRDEGLKDLEFLAGIQWDPAAKAEREKAGRPCMVINTLPQFIGQVIGDRRMNQTSIHVVPKVNADVDIADIRSGLIRSIEQHSKSERVYDMALEDQVGGGIGNLRVCLEYARENVFDQDIFIRPIPNPFAVVWDRYSVDATGRDAKRCFVQDIMSRKDYEANWGDRSPIPSDLSEFTNGGSIHGTCNLYGEGWLDKDSVRITEYWRIVEKPVRLVMLKNGEVHELHAGDAGINITDVMLDAQNKPIVRDTVCRWAVMYLITGWDILEGPYELRLSRLPIIRVNGREIRVGEKRIRFGLIRWARDPVRMRNYWRSVAVETLAMAPKNQWLAQQKSVKGREDDFREAHLTNDPLLIYNDGTEAPTREQGPDLPAAVLQEVTMNTQDIKDTTGLQDASLGIRSNEVSGKAIFARQQEGDVATIIYHDNLNMAIEEAGDVSNQLIPVCYDTIRTLRVIGSDEKPRLIRVNDPMDPKSPDLTKGEFDVEVITGPSATTQRMFAADAMLEAVKVNPQLMQIAGDLIVKAQDWPGAQEIAERLAKTIPPQLTQDPNQPPTPQMLQQQALDDQQKQIAVTQAQEAAEHQSQLNALELQEKSALVDKIQGEARKAHNDADLAEARTTHMDIGNGAESMVAPVRAAREIHDATHVPDLPKDIGNDINPAAGKPPRLTGRTFRRPRTPVKTSTGVKGAPKL